MVSILLRWSLIADWSLQGRNLPAVAAPLMEVLQAVHPLELANGGCTPAHLTDRTLLDPPPLRKVGDASFAGETSTQHLLCVIVGVEAKRRKVVEPTKVCVVKIIRASCLVLWLKLLKSLYKYYILAFWKECHFGGIY